MTVKRYIRRHISYLLRFMSTERYEQVYMLVPSRCLPEKLSLHWEDLRISAAWFFYDELKNM